MRFIQTLRSEMRSPSPAIGVWLVVAGLAGCASHGDLVDMEAFELVPPSEDPVPDRPDDATACPRRAAAVEAGALELDTTVCDWITVTTPSLLRLKKGQELELFFFHAPLAAEEPTEAVMEIRLAGEVVWHKTSPIPASDAFYEEALTVPSALDEGDPIVLHVHNHGSNTYTLGHLRAP